LRKKNFLFIFALICVLAAVPASAKTTRTVAKKGASKVVKAASKPSRSSRATSSRASSSRRGSAKGVASTANKGKAQPSVQVASRSPRQSEPTFERYIEIQQALVAKGFHAGPPTGQWGAEWVVALKRFQEAQKLNADGKLGALSLIALGLGPKREPLSHLAGKPEPIE
jgi:hypothetical protein